jgi:hypothetical protein
MHPLQPSGIPICAAPGDQLAPAAGFDGANFIVVWQDERSGNPDIYAARVNPSGVVVDTMSIPIATTSCIEGEPAIATGAVNSMLAWHRGHSHDYDIYATRIDQAGRILDPGGIPISTAQSEQINPRLTYGLSSYLVVWQDLRYVYYDVFATRLTDDGVVLDRDGIMVTHALHHQNHPDVAFRSLFAVVWQDKRSQVETDVWAARLRETGEIVDSTIVSSQISNQITPVITSVSPSGLLCLYSGWTDSLRNRPAHTMRIWGKRIYIVGVAESAGDAVAAGAPLTIFPNPFRRQAKIELGPEHRAKSIELKIYDISGRVVRRFNHSTIEPFDCVVWDGKDDSGRRLPTGVYFATLTSGTKRWTEKVVKLE